MDKQKYVEKTITFWKLAFVVDTKAGKKIVDPNEILGQVCCLPYDINGRRMEREDNTAVAIWQMTNHEPVSYRFGTQRTNEIPDEVDQTTGDIGPLALQQHKSILESAFFVLFDHGIIGYSSGMYAPRATQLREYLHKVVGNKVEEVLLEPLAWKDIDRIVEEIARSYIRRVAIRYNHNAPLFMAKYDKPMAEGLERLTAANPFYKEAMVSWGSGRGSKETGGEMNLIRQLPSLLRDDEVRINLVDLIIRYYNPETKALQTINLLDTLIVTKKAVLKLEGKRNVDPQDMCRCIVDAYHESFEDITGADSVVMHTWMEKDQLVGGRSISS